MQEKNKPFMDSVSLLRVEVALRPVLRNEWDDYSSKFK